MAVLMADYLAHAKKYYGTGESSKWHRIKLAIRPIKDLYAASLAADFGPVEFKAVRERLVAVGGDRTTTNAHMKRIVRMFKWAAAEGTLPASVHGTLALIGSRAASHNILDFCARVPARKAELGHDSHRESMAGTANRCLLG